MDNISENKKIIIVLITLVFTTFNLALSQGFNHDYPRVGFLQWGTSTYDWDAKFDLIISRIKSTSYPRFIKSKNPNAIVLATDDIQKGAWVGYDSMPDDWWFRDSQGNKIKIYGGGRNWTDYSDHCRRIASFGNRRFNEAIGDIIIQQLDLNEFDGIATDGLWITGHCPSDDIDIDRNGVNDFTEYGYSWVRGQLKDGAFHVLQNIRQAIGEDRILFINSGSFHREAWEISNGLWLEHFKGLYNSWHSFSSRYFDFMANARTPHVLLMDGFYDSKNKI